MLTRRLRCAIVVLASAAASLFSGAVQAAERNPLGRYVATTQHADARDILFTPAGTLAVATPRGIEPVRRPNTTAEAPAAAANEAAQWAPAPGTATAVHGERLYVADTRNHRVRICQLDGTVVATFGTRGHEPGQFISPKGIAVTAAGEVIVADTGNHRVQMFSADGVLHRYWGDWGPHPGFFASPHGVTSFEDRIFVADRDNHRIQVFDMKGNLLREWGRHATQPREGEGALHYPERIQISADGEWAAVLEPFEGRIQWFQRHPTAADPEARITRIPADSHMGPSCSVHGNLMVLTEPEGLTVQVYDLSIETPVLIAQFGEYGTGHGQFRQIAHAVFDPTGRFIDVTDAVTMRWQRFAVGSREKPLEYDPFLCRFAVGVALEGTQIDPVPTPGASTTDGDGNHYVIDRRGSRRDRSTPRVLKFSAAWQLLTTFGDDLAADRLVDPTSIAYDPWTQRVFVVDRGNNAILRFHRSGRLDGRLQPQVAAGRAALLPYGIAITAETLFLTGQAQHEVIAIDRAGAVVRRWGKTGLGRAEFLRPAGIAVTDDDRVIVMDHGNHRGQIFTPQGQFLKAFGARTYVRPTQERKPAPKPTIPQPAE